MDQYFINEAIDKSIENYLTSQSNKDGLLYNSFLVVIIRMLVLIYGELDIVNPYHIESEFAFNSNLMKFGCTKEEIDSFKRLMQGYYDNDKNNKSISKYFIELQKLVIDMFNERKINFGFTKNEINEFYNLLYTPYTNNALRISFNYLNAEDIYEIDNYFKSLKDRKKDNKDDIIAQVQKEDIGNIIIGNNNVPNQESPVEEFDTPIATGNGYVDILIIMSIIVTVVMVIFIFSFVKV